VEFGLESLWTPVVVPSKAGCHQDCNFCTQVCPTGAIQPLRIEVKRKTHMGRAEINPDICLPFGASGGREECNLCYDECRRAGYDAIVMRTIRIELDPPPPEGVFSDQEIEEMSRIQVPTIDSAACVGCGICEYRCHTRYVTQEGRFQESAIKVKAQNEHRLLHFPDMPEALPVYDN
jgi:NAD-dependent dihydropyrimidine dehydrogenase PreA subunit